MIPQLGSTALMFACREGHVDVVRHLVVCGKASVNAGYNVSVRNIKAP